MSGLIIHPEVSGEIAEAAKWYRKIDPELAERFLAEIYRGIGKVRDTPQRFRIVDAPYRRVFCDVFPYRIVFEIIEELQAVHIVAVTHQMRDPDQWKSRL